jgi:hypothetical protein
MEPEKPSRFPHPTVIAAREALKKHPPVALESVKQQILGAQEWHRRQTEGRSADARPATRLPHPDGLAARAALAKQPPASLEQVMIQAKASEEWRKRQSDGKSDS